MSCEGSSETGAVTHLDSASATTKLVKRRGSPDREKANLALRSYTVSKRLQNTGLIDLWKPETVRWIRSRAIIGR